MAGKGLEVVDVREIIRELRMGESDRRISSRTGASRSTVAKYREWSLEKGLLEEMLPELKVVDKILKEGDIVAPAKVTVSKAEPYRELIENMFKENCSKQVIFERLRDNHSFDGSYSSIKRFVNRLEDKSPEAFIRMEVAPGAEAQVDFGYCGQMFDPAEKRLRRSWAFVMTLSHSRYQFAKFTFDQKVETWLELHLEAFEFFGGVPKEIVLDNLKAAIVKAALYDPHVHRVYLELAEHYGFLISPCRVRTPRHKGKVEAGGIKYLKNNFLPGRTFIDILDGNDKLLLWCLDKGKRIHGTTKRVPLEVFDEVERKALLPLPQEPFEICTWKECKLHPDCHIVFDGSYYSAPHRLIGKRLWVRATGKGVRIFYEHKQVAMHLRALRKGERVTVQNHLPPEKVCYIMQAPSWCRKRAEEIGEDTSLFIESLLSDKPLNRLRTAQGVLRLAHKYGPGRLENACKRALYYNELRYGAVKKILKDELDKERLPEMVSVPSSSGKFARPWIDFVGGLRHDAPVNSAA